ncbi:MAG TPA: tRNA uracil 4-sulfurtransferase ThiI [Gemmatimonadales bacterium]|nr:tRNA uracil 4-sulfurtransferase ThiI [Gemmatimonadales bacterium]
MPLFLVRLAPEITTKARGTRRRFQRRLVRNLRDALDGGGLRARIEDRWSRIYVETADPAAGAQIANVFGVASVSEVEARIPADLEEIVRTGERLYGERVQGRRFAVQAHRAGQYPFGTQDIRVRLGAALDRYGDVDLDDPEVTVTVELREREAFLYSGRIPGVGGLPLGVEGKAVALISGGFDSPVAAWLMLKRGIALEYVFCNLGGAAYERSVLGVVKVLADQWSWGDRPVIHVVDFERPLAELRRTVAQRYWQVVLKRLMYRAAAAVAQAVRGEAIVTGESVGQVSSQTLGNLAAINEAVTLPVFRPLLGFDKNEIIARAERIGTAALSAQIREYCDIARYKPVTHSAPAAARAEEAKMDLAVLEQAVAARKAIDLRSLRPVDLVQPYLFASEIPEEAVVLDCRDAHHYRAWHYPGAERWDPADLAARFKDLDKARRYILYCSFGVQSAYLAEAMQRAGYEAYSFKGGVRELRRYAEARGVVAPA